uniref:Uncharacterized protein n=1 Tax=Oryza rufipogon TaxID=4529 RepID=A0A0E0QFU1_ORYRU
MANECDSFVCMMSEETHVEAYSLPMQNEDLHTSTNEHYHANCDFESDRNANSLEHFGLRNSPKFQTLESHKRPRSRKSSTPIESAGEEDEEGDDARKSTTPDLLQPSAKKRPM